MKEYERLWCSVSVLVGAVLAVFAFVPGAWRTGILLLVFAVWGIWVFMIILRPRIAWRRAQRNFLGRRRSTGDGQARFRAEETMVKHVNYRISARLHSAYPDASWEWETKDPARLIVRGGKGRLLLHGVPDYNYAEVDLRPNGRMECSLLRVVPVPSEHDGSVTVEGEFDDKAVPSFTSFPSKVHWPQTVRVLESEGYAADVDGEAIRVTW